MSSIEYLVYLKKENCVLWDCPVFFFTFVFFFVDVGLLFRQRSEYEYIEGAPQNLTLINELSRKLITDCRSSDTICTFLFISYTIYPLYYSDFLAVDWMFFWNQYFLIETWKSTLANAWQCVLIRLDFSFSESNPSGFCFSENNFLEKLNLISKEAVLLGR